MTIITAMDNKKGGTGKTTTAINLGTYLAAACGNRVLIIDLDSDRCITDGMAGGAFDAHTSNKLNILDCLADIKHGFGSAIIRYDITPYAAAASQLASLVHMPYVTGGSVDLITGSEDLAEAPVYFNQQKQPVGTFDQSLHWMLRQPDVTERWDQVILDIGTGWDLVTKTAIFAADEAIIPVEPASLSIEAFKRHNLRINKGNTDRRRAGLIGQTIIRGVLISRYNAVSPVHQQFVSGMRQMLAGAQIPCFTTVIPTSDAILVAMHNHAPSWGQYPDDPGAQAFASLAKEISVS